jgi:hypothetical protein
MKCEIASMCYILLLSTTSEEDLTKYNNEFVRFTRDLPVITDTEKLKYKNRWYIGSRTGCSCAFRHLYSIELGFHEPVEWYEEEPDDIEATLQLIRLIRSLVEKGEGVDCMDTWEHQDTDPISEVELEVDLAKVSNAAFRFFENHHFLFKQTIESADGAGA